MWCVFSAARDFLDWAVPSGWRFHGRFAIFEAQDSKPLRSRGPPQNTVLSVEADPPETWRRRGSRERRKTGSKRRYEDTCMQRWQEQTDSDQ